MSNFPLGSQKPNLPPPDPAAFNRYARYIRYNLNTTSISGVTPTSNAVRAQPIKLPSVGYGYRAFAWWDLALTVTTVSNTPRFRSGNNIASTNLKFPAPWGFVRRAAIEINGAGKVWDTPGYENWVLQQAANRGRRPFWGLDVFGTTTTGTRGFGSKEAQFALTKSAGSTPLLTYTFGSDDSAIADGESWAIRFMTAFPLTLGESAVAGLIPWQDYRVQPVMQLEYGNVSDLCAGTLTTAPLAGTIYACCDYFEAPAGVRPDTRFIKQTLFQSKSITGTGEKRWEPNLGGGIMLRTFISLWHGSATDASQYAANLQEMVSSKGYRVQANTTIDDTHPAFATHDETRWYSKLLPHNVLSFDHIASGFGDPGMPSLRDPIRMGRLTQFEYFYTLSALTTQGEERAVYEQLLPAPQVSAVGVGK